MEMITKRLVILRTGTAIFLAITTAVFGIAGIWGIVPAVLSCMAFDAPGSIASPLVWLLVIVVGSFPLVCLGGIAGGWACYFARRQRLACCVALAPVLNISVLTLMLWGGGELGRTSGFLGGLFVHRFGTAHQRLAWKAEECFANADVVALCKAIEAKDLKEIDRLAKAGVNIKARGRGNMTPLLWAFPMGEAVFGKMLDLGADPNVQLTDDFTAGNVMPCTIRGLEKGKSVTSASVELTDGYFRDQVVRNINMDGYLELVLKHGGNPNLEDLEGNTPLFYAFWPRRTRENIRLLLGAGADSNHRNHLGKTPVMSDGACKRCYDYKLALLEFGADYRIADNQGWDLILQLEDKRRPGDSGGFVITESEVAEAKPVIEWLTGAGVNWQAARDALAAPRSKQDFKNLPADYSHRPWLPQRPTLRKDKAGP